MQDQPQPNPRSALYRLLIVLTVAIGFIIYSYGWTVTDINLERPQEQQRQENVQSALRDLLSPNIFEQEREVIDIYANFRIICEPGETVDQPEDQYQGAVVSITPDCGEPGDVVQIEVTGFEPLAEGRVRWDPPGEDAQSRPRQIIEIGREDFVFTENGNFSGSIEVPRIRGTEGEISQITIRAAVPVGAVQLSDTSQQVIGRMAETIFMALVATTVAIPIAALISFLAARNLMYPIRLSVGSMLVAFIAFATGIALGAALLTPIANLGVQVGSSEAAGALMAFVIPLAVILGTFLLFRATVPPTDAKTSFSYTRLAISVGMRVIFALALVFTIGAVGGLGILGSQQIHNLAEAIRGQNVLLVADGVDAVANLLGVLGELVALFTLIISAVVGAFVFTGVITGLVNKPLRGVQGLPSILIAGVLGVFSGGILMGVIGLIGTWAALLGLLSPIIAAFIGGQIPGLIYRRIFAPAKPTFRRTALQHTLPLVLFAIGAVVTFVLSFEYLNIGRALIDGTLPPQVTRTIFGLEVSSYVFNNIMIGALLGGLTGLLAGLHFSFPLGTILYNVSRTTLNTVRSIEPLIMGLVFVIWVGIGPFAGVLALTLHSIAALGKLYSEQVENIDDGPLEALMSTGASRLQTIIYAVVPQIIPPYIAFTMYRWDINVRMSTIIGFVGGGGIGLLLQQQINLLRYRDAGVAVLAIAVVVSILDYASASIRSRIT